MSQNREINEAWEHYKEETLWASLEDAFRAGWLASQRARRVARIVETVDPESVED